MSDRGAAVTVVIPVWNAPYVELLPRAVESVRTQDEGVSILVVDNASELSVPALAGTTIVASAERLSAGEARNYALERVSSEFVLFLDADDELVQGALDNMRRELAGDPRLAVYAMSIVESETGRRHRFPRRSAYSLSRCPQAFAVGTAVWSLYSTQGCALLRTDAVRECGGYADLSGPEDWALAVSQAFRGRIRLDRQPGVIKTLHPDSLSHDQPRRAMVVAAREVRRRLRTDHAVPVWGRALMPVIWALQLLMIFGLRPIHRALSSAKRR